MSPVTAMTLPPAAVPAPAVLSPAQRQRLRHGVLVVEDDPLQRELVLDLLRALGIHRLYQAADGEQAFALLAELTEPPAAMVLDLDLPRLDGFATMRRMAAEAMEVAVLVLSGSEPAVLESTRLLGEELGLFLLGVCAKPCDAPRLLTLLARIEHLHPHCRHVAHPESAEVCCEELRAALAQGWIQPHYQPKIDLAFGRVDGFEALARWQQPDGTRRSPDQFVAVAEREQLIDELTFAVLDRVLANLRDWSVFAAPWRIAFNVSARSLSKPDFADRIVATVARAGVAPARLILEVTESALATDLAQALCSLGRLRMQGFGLAIDDYGTGFSSLQQLARMPFSELKIDRSFVRHAHEGGRHHTILGSAIEVGRRLGLDTVAEGIETMQELALVRSLGCSHAQGFLFARAMPADEVLVWWRELHPTIGRLCEQPA